MSWEQLGSVINQNKSEQARDRHAPPLACPFDGEPLDILKGGDRNCKLGNYTWRGGPSISAPQ
jgi:hypothetical protein